MIIADTSGLLALVVKEEPHHDSVVTFVRSTGSPLIVSPLVLAEFDYLVRERAGVATARTVLKELFSSKSIDIPSLSTFEIQKALEIDVQYADLEIGVTDATLVVLAQRYQTGELLTLDETHFRAVRPLQGGFFRILPADL